jgi:hypothetical protein
MQVLYDIESCNDNVPISYSIDDTVAMDFCNLNNDYGNADTNI